MVLGQRSKFEQDRDISLAMDAVNLDDTMNLPDKKVKGDFMPEIYFIGQIVGGTDFPTDQDGIFVEASLKYGTNWELIKTPQGQSMQTHTAYADDEGFFIFAHPFDFNFIVKSIEGW